MDYCFKSEGAYCEDHPATCQTWVNICSVYSLLFELLSVNFSVVAERDRAHSLITELLTDGGFEGRFPEGVFVNFDEAPYSHVLSQIQRTLDIVTRPEEKLAKETGLQTQDISPWEFDDALNAYYKGLKDLNRLVFSGDSVYDRTSFESAHGLIWG